MFLFNMAAIGTNWPSLYQKKTKKTATFFLLFLIERCFGAYTHVFKDKKHNAMIKSYLIHNPPCDNIANMTAITTHLLPSPRSK